MRRAATHRRRRAGSPYEMQQFSLTRVPLQMTDGPGTTVVPFQFLTCLVSPREEHATIFDAQDSPPVPADARGCTVGGIRFRYDYSVNLLNQPGIGGLVGTSSLVTIKSAILVIPLDPSRAQTFLAGSVSPNVLSQQGTQVEDPAGLATSTYFRPRILWRGLDHVRYVGLAQGSAPTASTLNNVIQMTSDGNIPDLQVVKSRVRLAMDEALYFLTEVTTGFTLDESSAATFALSIFGVLAVKRITRGRGGAA